MLKPTVQVHNVDGILVAEFWDCLRLDPAPVVDFIKKYEAHVAMKGRPEVVVDLLGVDFAGSTALGHFVSLHRLARPRGGRLIFCNVDPTVLEVFRVTKLDTLFSFAPDRSAALAMAQAPSPPTPEATTPGPLSAAMNAPDGEPEANGPTRPPRCGPSNNSLGSGLLRGSRRRRLS
jgi:anti-anti-sigma factor